MIMPIILHIRKKKMDLKRDLKTVVLSLLFLSNLSLGTVQAEVLKTINVSMPTNYGTFFGEIHFSEKDLELALKVERIIKEDLTKVINYFEYVPYDVVHFNIDPFLRLTNGNAVVFPTNIINLYNYPANNSEHLIVMENWLQGLVLHEFVHVTHLDQTRGYLQTGREIFGTIGKIPAGIVPRWFTEGIAVWGESYLVSGGRLNNPLFNKEFLLQFKKENFCKTIDCLDSPGNFPNGQLAYWAGAYFMEYVEKIKPKSIKCLVEFNSNSLPFFLNNAFESCVGEKAESLFEKFRKQFITNEESKLAGDKISNVFGSDDFQKGLVLDGDHLFKVENEKKSEALVAYDLKDGVSSIAKYDAPISDIASMVNEENQSKMLLVSFNEDPSFRLQNKTWKLIDPETLLVEKKLNFANDPSYVVALSAGEFLTLSYIDNHWQAENSKSKEVLKKFSSLYNIVLVKKIGNQLLLKINDSFGFSSLVVSDFNFQNLVEIYKSDKVYDLPIVTDSFWLVRSKEELLLFETSKNILQSSLPQDLLKNISFAVLNKDRNLILEDGLKTQVNKEDNLENLLLKNKAGTKSVEGIEYKIQPAPTSSFASEKAEAFPRFDHLSPHYWFLAFGTSDNLGSVGAMTAFSDPMEIYSLNATILAYASESKIGGTLDYTQKLINVSDLWSASAYFNQEYSKTKFNSTLISDRDFELRTRYKIYFKKLIYIPGVVAGASATEDFISNQTNKFLGTSQFLSYEALSYDDFFQSFIGIASLKINQTSIGESYLSTQLKSTGTWRFINELEGSIKGSFSKLFKSDFSRGVLFGGGVTNTIKVRDHEFYGLPYSNAYGNEIFSSRLQLDYRFWDIYRGKNLLPFFFKEAHLLAGNDSLYADRIFLDGEFLKNKMINSLYIGPRIKMNIFYHVPANIDLIFSRIANPNGKSVNQAELTFYADMF